VTVVLTLALGIGANTAVFSQSTPSLLRPLPFPDGDRLVLIEQVVEGSSNTGLAPVRIADWNRQNSTFDGITGYYVDDVVDTRGELPTRFRRAFLRASLLRRDGVSPLGHGFGAVDHHYGGPITLIISAPPVANARRRSSHRRAVRPRRAKFHRDDRNHAGVVPVPRERRGHVDCGRHRRTVGDLASTDLAHWHRAAQSRRHDRAGTGGSRSSASKPGVAVPSDR
jgi:hypothetical protein